MSNGNSPKLTVFAYYQPPGSYKIFMSGFWEENRRLLFTAATGPVSYLSGGVQW